MKKLLKATLITLIAVFALLGASVTALAASGYVKKREVNQDFSNPLMINILAASLLFFILFSN